MLSLPLSTIIEACLAGYVVLGCRSMGYIIVRSGWPGIRATGGEYKSGSSLLAGAGLIGGTGAFFAILLAAPNFAAGLGGFELLALSSALAAGSGIALLTAKRKFEPRRKARISVPKRIVTAGIVSKMAVGMLPKKLYTKDGQQEGAEGQMLMGPALSAAAQWQQKSPAAGNAPYAGAAFEESSEGGIMFVSASKQKKNGNEIKIREEYTTNPTSETSASEGRISELKARLIDKAQGQPAQPRPAILRQEEPGGTEERQNRARGEAVFEPTREIIEKIVEKQKSAPGNSALGGFGIDAPILKAPAQAAKPASAPPARKMAGAQKGGIFSSIFGAKPAAAPVSATAAPAAKPTAPIQSPLAKPPAAPLPPAFPAQVAAKPASSAAPTRAIIQIAAPKPAARQNEIAQENSQKEMYRSPEPYIVARPQSAEKIAELKKRLSELGASKPLGEQLLASRDWAAKSTIGSLRQGIAVQMDQQARARGREQEKNAERIIGLLGMEKQRRSESVTTREKSGEELHDSLSFIREELRQRLGLERPAADARGLRGPQDALPKSARLLKELLKEG